MNTIKSKSLMKFIRTMLDHHREILKNPLYSADFQAESRGAIKTLKDVRIVAAECIKEGEWLAKRGGK